MGLTWVNSHERERTSHRITGEGVRERHSQRGRQKCDYTDMKYRQPQLPEEQRERGRRIDQEEVKVISQEVHLKVICDAKG